MSWLQPTSDGSGVFLDLRVLPRAGRNEICGTLGNVLKVKLHAPPVQGRANEALRAFLAERIGVPKGRIVLAKGELSQNKRVLIRGVSADAVRKAVLG